jgi:hypothetical protein
MCRSHTFRLPRVLKHLWHSSSLHSKGFELLWVDMCAFRLLRWANPEEQLGHLKGRSPVWERR